MSPRTSLHAHIFFYIFTIFSFFYFRPFHRHFPILPLCAIWAPAAQKQKHNKNIPQNKAPNAYVFLFLMSVLFFSDIILFFFFFFVLFPYYYVIRDHVLVVGPLWTPPPAHGYFRSGPLAPANFTRSRHTFKPST